MSDTPRDGDRPSLQSEAHRLADAARERAADAIEEVKVASNQIVDKVRELIEEGNVRRISLRKGEKTIFEIPLTVGAGAAAAALLYNPLIAGVGAVAALVSDLTLVVERDETVDRTPGAAEGASTPPDDTKASTPAAKDAGSADAAGKTVGKTSTDDDAA